MICSVCRVRLALEEEPEARCAVCAETARKEFRSVGVTPDQARLGAF
jgi:hypothetical protein